jgi:DNA-binding NtrC family response regulator
VDDDQDLREMWLAFGTLNQIAVDVAATVAEARAHLAVRRFDLVVCDFNLGATETAAELVPELVRAGAPCIVVTGNPSQAVDVLKGSVPVLSKPVDFADVLRRLETRGLLGG